MFGEAGEAHLGVAKQSLENQAAIKRICARLRRQPPPAVVTCGRGSSDHAATFGRYLIESRLGLLTSSASLSITSVYAARQQLVGVLYLAISQSGRSLDLLACVEAAKAAGAFTIAFVNDPASPLAQLADEVLPLHAGPELSVAATKSCITALTGLAQLVGHWAEDQALVDGLSALPNQLAQAWELDWSAAIPSLRSARNLFVLGRGLGLGAAQEAALKLKETCGLHAEAFSTAEVKHGPMVLVEPNFPILAFGQSDASHTSVKAVATEFAGRGADVWLAEEGPSQPGRLPVLSCNPALQPILMIQSFYRLANAVSLARGRNPDVPPHLNKITETV
jgi:glucosamine--fructose-6-phosphate aminotransferase (isomerizing)